MKRTSIAVGFLILAALACVVSPGLFRGSLNAVAEPSPPPYCNPCLFYGGDFDPSGAFPNALDNQDSVIEGYAAVYVPFTVPPNQTWTVGGFFSNNVSPKAKLAPLRLNGQYQRA